MEKEHHLKESSYGLFKKLCTPGLPMVEVPRRVMLPIIDRTPHVRRKLLHESLSVYRENWPTW